MARREALTRPLSALSPISSALSRRSFAPSRSASRRANADPATTETRDHEFRGLTKPHPGDRLVGAGADRLELFLRRAAIAEGPSGPDPDADQRPPARQTPRRPAQRRPAGAGAAAPRRRAEALAASPRVPIDTPSLGGSIDLTGGLIDDLMLKAYRETIDPNSPNITLFSPPAARRPIGPRPASSPTRRA